MNEIKTGGPAFPFFQEWANERVGSDGMTLRDYFAAKAMQGLLTDPSYIPPEQVAKASYLLADAMLAAREVSHG